jgi:type IV secretion system protein VirD4
VIAATARLFLILATAAFGWAVVAAVIAFGPLSWWVAIFFGCYLVAKHRRSGWWAHGTARWADWRDLWWLVDVSKGLRIGRLAYGLPSMGQATSALVRWPARKRLAACTLFLERLKKRPLGPHISLQNVIHASLFAPVGVGKTTGFIIPHMLSNFESMVAIDFKPELATATMKTRKRQGHRVVLLDPFERMGKNPDCFNPFDFIANDNPDLIDATRQLAEALVVRTKDNRDPHWEDSAIFVIQAVSAFIARFAPAGDRSLQTLRDIVGNPILFKKAIEGLCACDDFDGLLARLGHQLAHYQDKELNSVLTTCNRFLRFLDSPALVRSTGSSTFAPAQLKRGRMTVYLILPLEHVRDLSPLLRMWISSLLRAVVQEGLDESRKVHFILDEAAVLGQMDCIDSAIDQYRGFGVRLLFAFQSMGQLAASHPAERSQVLLSNTTQIFAGVNDQQTADYVSARLGEATIIVEGGGSNVSRSYSSGSDGSQSQSVQVSRGTNDSWQQQARKLLKPEEVIALPRRQCITFTPGLPPIFTTLVPYFEEPWLYGQDRLERFRTSMGLLLRAAVFLFFGIIAAGTMTVIANDRMHWLPAQAAPALFGEEVIDGR